MQIEQKVFGKIEDQEVVQFSITNKSGFTVRFINYGCVITDIIAPDRDENMKNVVLGFDRIEDYEKYSPYFGAVVGRIAGRIANGQFELNGKTFQITRNEGENHLHGGIKGFSHALWDYKVIDEKDAVGVEFSYTSEAGEEGFPGKVEVTTTYLVNENNQLDIHYRATTDEDTIINLTNHTYFNLSGDLNKTIKNHELQLDCSRYLELKEDSIPTGKYIPVEGTPFDFNDRKPISQGVDSGYKQNEIAGNGFDHPFVLDSNFNREIELHDPESGRKLVVETDQPAVVIYTCNQSEGDYEIRGVKPHHHMAICLETQGFPDAINQPDFPPVILKKDDVYQAHTRFIFE